MTTNFRYDSSKNFYNDFGQAFSDTIYSTTLAASTPAVFTVPSTVGLGQASSTGVNKKFLALFSYTSGYDVFVTTKGTAAVPAGNTFASTYSELNPKAKVVNSGDIISCISTGTPSCTVTLYNIWD
jgi:hypothetical protein